MFTKPLNSNGLDLFMNFLKRYSCVLVQTDPVWSST